LKNLASGAKQAAEKGVVESEALSEVWQGLKPNVDLIGFVGPTKVVPFYKAFEIGG